MPGPWGPEGLGKGVYVIPHAVILAFMLAANFGTEPASIMARASAASLPDGTSRPSSRSSMVKRSPGTRPMVSASTGYCGKVGMVTISLRL